MSLDFKNTTLLILIVWGFILFWVNAFELNSNYKNLKISKTSQFSKITSNLKTIPNKTQIENKDSNKDFSKNVKLLTNKETVIVVQKGQTFSSIINNFNFENKKKSEIINAINAFFDLREFFENFFYIHKFLF